jgi:hypothetical protein
MEQYFNLIESDQPCVEDNMWVLTTNEDIYIQVLSDGTYFVYNDMEEVGPADNMQEAMTMALAADVIEEFAKVFEDATVNQITV